MSNLTLSSPVYYRAGVSGVSAVVGVESQCSRVARYSFVSPASGASAVSLSLTSLVLGDANGIRPQTMGFYIGTDPTSHINAGAAAARTGTLALGADKTSFSGSADVLLLPGKQYYLFLFPTHTEYGWFSLELASVSLGAAGGSYSVPTLSASAVALGGSVTVSTNRHSSAFTHTVTYAFGAASGTIAAGVGASVSWTPPLELARQIPSAASGTGTIYCTTYSGDAQIGPTQSVPVTLTVPDGIKPTVTAAWTDSAGADSAVGVLTKLVSRLKVSVSAAGSYGSTVTATSMTLNGKAFTGGTLLEAGTLPLVVTVTDSRGRSGSASYSLTVADYQEPQLTLSASRCTENGTADDTGEYCKVTLSGSTTQVNGKNTAALKLGYGTESKDIAVDLGSFTRTEILPAPSTATLALSATLSDKLLAATRSMTLSVGYATLDLLKGGRGIAFGATATKEGFECAMPACFTGTVQGPVLGRYLADTGANVLYNAGYSCLGKHSTAGLLLIVSTADPNHYALCYYNYVWNEQNIVKTIASNGLQYVANVYGTVSARDESNNGLSAHYTVMPCFATA